LSLLINSRDEVYTLHVIVKYVISSDEYLEAQRAYRLRMEGNSRFFRNLYGLAGIAAILGVYLQLSKSGWWAGLLYLVAAALLLERTLLCRIRAAADYQKSASIREPVDLTIDENHLLLASGGDNTEIRWANVLACHETKNVFLLRTWPEEFLVIPKRAFSPGDLFHFKELRQKELIVKETRENSDVVLLKFAVSWGLLAMAAIALFIGYVHTFFTGLPGTQGAYRPSTPQYQAQQSSGPASRAQLNGTGTVYLVPLGAVKFISVAQLVANIRKRYGLELHLLPAVPPPAWAKNLARNQFAAEDLLTAIKIAYPKLAADPGAILIGLTEEDMYISGLEWNYAFSFRDEERFAVISSRHLPENEDGKTVSPEILDKRVLKVLIRDLGILHYRLQPSANYKSVLYQYVDDASELDDIGDEYLESDTRVRADLHVQTGDPCFIVRHYVAPERKHPDWGTVGDCSGYYKELDLETVQIDLRYGLLLDQRTDFLIRDRIPLELTRVSRTEDSRSRAFGIGGNHNLNIFLVGDKWPFTWIDLILEDGGRAHFRRSNWGYGYWDARYTSHDALRSRFSGSTIDWAWPGWKLKSEGKTYQFPDGGAASRPEQGALVGITAYDGSRLVLDRDATGNLLHARSPSAHLLVFKYDHANRVTEIGQNSGGRFEYSYDAGGHLVHVTDASQRTTEYSYDQAGRMSSIVQSGTKVCELTYDEGGRVKSETLADGRTYIFKYSMSTYPRTSELEVVGVDISDSAGPQRKVRLTRQDYLLDVMARP